MFGNLNLGRPLGIPLSVHWSFWLLPFLVLFSNFGPLGAVATGLKLALLFAVFGCVALHELGHAAAARLFGIRTRDIVLYPLGGVASLERMPRNPLQEIVVALAGPSVNVVIAALLLPVVAIGGPVESAGLSFVGNLFWANVGLVLFNMLPAFPMDGGRVFRAGLALFTSRVRATQIAATVGTGFAILFGVAGLLGMMGVGVLGLDPAPPMLLVIAVFLFLVGQAEEQGVRAEEEARERRPFRGVRMGWPIRVGVPVVTNARPADGWEFNATNGMWTKWEHGVAVGRYRNP